jgi:UDP-N-acetylglucosamine acyltransferase
LKKAYRILFQSKKKTSEALEKVRAEIPPSAEIELLVTFIEGSQRGICR